MASSDGFPPGTAPLSSRAAAEAESDVAPVRQAYAAFGATDQLEIVEVQGGHYWRPEILVPWLSDQLRALAQANP